MPLDSDLLAGTLVPLVAALPRYDQLTRAERDEVVRMAQGLAAKDSAAATNVSPETVRGRRRHIYIKLRVRGADELLRVLLEAALRRMDPREEAARVGGLR